MNFINYVLTWSCRILASYILVFISASYFNIAMFKVMLVTINWRAILIIWPKHHVFHKIASMFSLSLFYICPTIVRFINCKKPFSRSASNQTQIIVTQHEFKLFFWMSSPDIPGKYSISGHLFKNYHSIYFYCVISINWKHYRIGTRSSPCYESSPSLYCISRLLFLLLLLLLFNFFILRAHLKISCSGWPWIYDTLNLLSIWSYRILNYIFSALTYIYSFFVHFFYIKSTMINFFIFPLLMQIITSCFCLLLAFVLFSVMVQCSC